MLTPFLTLLTVSSSFIWHELLEDYSPPRVFITNSFCSIDCHNIWRLLKFHLLLGMTKNELINNIHNSLLHLNVSKVILFGSYAKGMNTDGSDVDLLVVTNDNFTPNSFTEKMEVKMKIANALNPLRKFTDIDLIVYTKPMYERFLALESSFKREIITTGDVIYSRWYQ